MLWALGDAHVCVRAAELAAVPHGATGLLVLRRHELDRLNGIRPFFSERALRMVLLADDETAVEALRRAPDLMDWVSEVVEAEPLVPGFVVESIRLIADAFPGFEWVGEPEDLISTLLAVFPGEAVDEAPPFQDAERLIDALDTRAGWLLFLLADESDVGALRMARAVARPRGELVVIGRSVPGWPRVDPSTATWSTLETFEPPISGAEAARSDCEVSMMRRGPVAPTVDALAGESDLPTLRATLTDPSLPRLRRRLIRRAHRALRDGDVDEVAVVAAWADRARTLPQLDPPPTELVQASWPLALRLGRAHDPIALQWTLGSERAAVLMQSRRTGEALAHAGRAWLDGHFSRAEAELANTRFTAGGQLLADIIRDFIDEARGRPANRYPLHPSRRVLLRERLVPLIDELADDPGRLPAVMFRLIDLVSRPLTESR